MDDKKKEKKKKIKEIKEIDRVIVYLYEKELNRTKNRIIEALRFTYALLVRL